MASENKTLKRGIELYIDGKQVQANMKQVEAEARKLKKEIDGMTVGSKEYFEATKRYQELNRVLREHKNELKGIETQQQSLLSKGIQLFKDYSLQITGAVAALTGVSMKINAFRKQAAEKEDAAANLKALTGLDDENIQWLTQQAEKLSTTMEASGLRVRKSATEILEAYMLVGSAKPELLKDKQALNAVTIEAMQLAEAAKMELKDAVEAVTTSLNQYSAGADKAARFTNVLAAGSKFGAANVQDQAAAVVKAGVAASSANVSFEQLVGVIEMLGEKGIKAEEAGTALKRFFLQLQTGANDTNPAVVGLDKALENLAAKQLSMGDLQKMFGDRAINVAKILIDNTEKVKEYTKAVTGTNTAVEQAAINSDTVAAKMAQNRNQINLTGQELAKTLAPIISQTVGWTRKFVLALPAMIDFLKKYGAQLAILAVAYNALAIKTALSTAAQTAWTFAVGVAKNVGLGLRAMLLTLHAGYTLLTKGMAAAKVEMMAVNTVMKSNAFGLLITAGVALYEIISRLINRTKNLTKEQRLQRDMARDIQQAEREGNSQRANSESKIRSLSAVIHDNTRSLNDRRIALHELKKIVPGYHGQLTAEGTLIRDNTKALTDYLDKMKEVAVQKALQGKMDKLVEAELNEKDSLARRKNAVRVRKDRLSAFDAKYKDDDIIQSLIRNGIGANQLNYGGGYMAVSKWMEKYDVGRLKAQRQISAILGQRNKLVAEIKEAEGWVKEVDDRIDNLQKRQENLQKQGYDIVKTLPQSETQNTTVEPVSPTLDPTYNETETERNKRIREELEAIDAEYNKRAAALKQQYIDGDIKTEQEYASRLKQIELERLRAKMQVAGLDEKQSSDFLQRIMDMEMNIRKRIEEMTKVSAKDTVEARLEALQKEYDAGKAYLKDAYENGIIPSEKRYKEYLLALEKNYNFKKKELLEKQADEQIAELKKQQDAELQELKLHLAQRLLTEREYEEALIRLRVKYAEKRRGIQNQSKEATAATAQEEADVEIAKAEEASKKLEEYAEQLKDIASDVQDAFGDLGEELAEAIFGGDFLEGMKNAGKEFLKQALDIVEKYIMIKQAQIMADQIAEASTFVGIASAILKATAKMAAIKMAFGLAKGAVASFDTGGFTANGRWNEPKGIVHSNEFVANRHAVQNPQVLPVLQLIDAAQRSGSISNLTGNDIAAVATGFAPASKSVYSPINNAQTQPIDLSPLYATLLRLEKVMNRATDAYKEPSPAYCYVNGRGGINEAQELNETINHNASRK